MNFHMSKNEVQNMNLEIVFDFLKEIKIAGALMISI